MSAATGALVGKAYVALMPKMDGFSKKVNASIAGMDFGGGFKQSLSKSFSGAGDGIKSGLGNSVAASMGEAGDKGSKAFGTRLKSGLKTAAVGATAGIAATIGAGLAIGKQALDNYADYEQLVGGIDTLFKESSQKVQEYANSAYKTTGQSANEYMEQVTGFSASLLQSVGGDTAKAADDANLAMTDMADNANKMGTDMGRITDAYQGFAKQNYTMLDNLKLGYGGTKSEMERLLADAQAISGVEYNIDSFDDIVQAIHVVQTEMGITGTTAKEAMGTISGSVAMAQSSWQNWLTGLGNENADMSQLTGQLLESVTAVINNVVPRIGEILVSLVENLPQVITSILTMLFEYLPQFVDAGMKAIAALVQGLAQALPTLIPQLVQCVMDIVQILIDNLPLLLEAGKQLLIGLVQGLVNAIPVLIESLPQLITSIVDFVIESLPIIIDLGIQLFLALIEALPQIIEAIVAAAPQIIDALVSALGRLAPKLVEMGGNLIAGLGQGIIDGIGGVVDALWGGVSGAIDTVAGWLGIHSPSTYMRDFIGKNMALGVKVGWEQNDPMDAIRDSVRDGVDASYRVSAQAVTRPAPAPRHDATDGDVVDALLNALSNMGIYVDGVRLAGVTANARDRVDGSRMAYANRGLAV